MRKKNVENFIDAMLLVNVACCIVHMSGPDPNSLFPLSSGAQRCLLFPQYNITVGRDEAKTRDAKSRDEMECGSEQGPQSHTFDSTQGVSRENLLVLLSGGGGSGGGGSLLVLF